MMTPFEKLAERLSRRKSTWIINNLLDVLVCSIAEYFYSLFFLSTRPKGASLVYK